MLIGVISDTHGLLRPQVFEIFRDVDRILHAGDIGPPDLLAELGALAPVDAVYGNTDTFPLISDLPETRVLKLAGRRILVSHIVPSIDFAFRRWPLEDIDVVVFGHSHSPSIETQRGTLFFNPGSAGPRRFRLPVSVGLLVIEGDVCEPRLVELQLDPQG